MSILGLTLLEIERLKITCTGNHNNEHTNPNSERPSMMNTATCHEKTCGESLMFMFVNNI